MSSSRTEEDLIQEVLIIEGQNRLYDDNDFLPVKQSLYYSEISTPDYDESVPYLVWCRPNQIYKQPSYFAENLPDYPYCVTQGTLPDETFIGVLMAVATYPTHKQDLISNIFASNPDDVNKFGVYTCRFYVEGAWVDVITDSSIPCTRDPDSGEFTPTYSTSANENELWICLAEKAYAKAVGNYEALQKVRIRESLMHLTGGSVQQAYIQNDKEFPVENFSCPKLWGLINRSIRQDTMILVEPIEVNNDDLAGFAEGKEGTTNESTATETGLGGSISDANFGGEAEHSFQQGRLYSIILTRIIDGSEVVLMHDPWSQPGEQAWKGDWSIGSSKWDVNNGEYLDEVEMDETIPWKREYPAGYFWIPLKSLRKYFNSMHLNKLFPKEKFSFYCISGEWHKAEAGGPMNSVRDKNIVKREARHSHSEAIHQNSAAVVVDGDCHWFNNPQFRIKTNKKSSQVAGSGSTIVYISLVPVSGGADGSAGLIASLTVTSMPLSTETPDRVWDVGTSDVVAVDKVDGYGHSKGQEVSIWALKLEDDKVYHVIPSTHKRNQDGSFIVRLFSTHSDLIVDSLDKVITQCFTGDWRRVGDLDTTGGPPMIAAERSGAGGGVQPIDANGAVIQPGTKARDIERADGLVENSKWCQNPQYHLEMIDSYAKDYIHLKIILRRTDKAQEGQGRRNQQSMIGNIADLKAEMTVGLSICKADCLEDLTPTKQVKKGPRQNALGQFIAAKPSSLKKRPGYIEESSASTSAGAGTGSSSSNNKTILRKSSLNNPVSYHIQSSFSHKSESTIYYPRLPRSWVGNGLIITPSLSEKGVKGSYELEINCSEPLRIKQLPDAFNRTIAGEWRDNECGGNHLSQLWKKNPRYVLKFRNSNKGNAPSRTRIVLTRHGEKWKTLAKKDTVGCMIGFYIFINDKIDGGAGEQRLIYESPFAPDDTFATPADFTLEALGDKEEYIIMPTTFSEDKKGAFILSLASDYEYTIVKEK
jgi:hypothetical protein